MRVLKGLPLPEPLFLAFYLYLPDFSPGFVRFYLSKALFEALYWMRINHGQQFSAGLWLNF